MARSYIHGLSDDLLINILWPSKQLTSYDPIEINTSTDFVLPRPTYTSENPYGDEPNTPGESSFRRKSNSPLTAPPALTDVAYNLLIASVCSRWRRLARQHISMLVVKENRAVSLRDLTAAIACFQNLSHVHLSDNSVESIDDAFLARLAAACPTLVSLHVGKGITPEWAWDREDEHPVTEAGLDHFVRSCTQLQHLSLYCLHRYGKPPASLSLLTDLHTLTLTHSAALQAPGFTNLCSLATLSVDISEHDEELDLTTLVHLPAFANLALCGETKLNLEGENAHPVSFARMAHLESLEFDYNSPRFSLLFPSGVTFSRLERLLLSGCDKLERLPDDIGERMPHLRDLTISSCHNLPELPDHFTSLHCLQKLTISSLDLASLPASFGKLSVLKDLTLHRLPISGLPDSFHQLTSLEVLNVHDCLAMVELGASFGSLHALKSLSIANSPKLVLPEDIGVLTDLHTFRVTLNSVQELLPSSFTQLMSLTRLELNLCDMIQELPEGLERLSNLRELSIWSRSTIQKLPESITDLGSLEVLRVDGCSSLCSIPGSLSALGRLRELAIGKCAQLPELSNSLPPSLEVLSLGCPQQLTPLTELPVLPMLRHISLTSVVLLRGLVGIVSLSSLEHLELALAGEAEELPLSLALCPNLRTLTIHSAARLKALPDDLGSAVQQLRQLRIERAGELRALPDSLTHLHCLTSLQVHAPKLPSLPDGIGALSRLRVLNLAHCSSLTCLPASLTRLSCLHELNLGWTAIRSLPCRFAQLSRLKTLDLQVCEHLQSLPDDFTQLKMLHRLNVRCAKVIAEDGGLPCFHGALPEPCCPRRRVGLGGEGVGEGAWALMRAERSANAGGVSQDGLDSRGSVPVAACPAACGSPPRAAASHLKRIRHK
ncbi:unnamed protein product [Closterium sp. Naga37s-1]|nr:unnamed protein product [Closterium sp. Naga37s-1]